MASILHTATLESPIVGFEDGSIIGSPAGSLSPNPVAGYELMYASHFPTER